MKRTRSGWLWVLWLGLLGASGYSAAAGAQESGFAGRWDLAIETPQGEQASWIEVSGMGDHLAIRMVGVSGHATAVHQVEAKHGELRFTATKEDQGFAGDMVFTGSRVGGALQGTVSGAAGERWKWTGVPAPSLGRTGEPRWGSPIAIFNGRDLTGWRLRNESKGGSWSVVDGTLVSTGPGSDLISSSSYGDFKLHVEFKSGRSSNSGIYLRGRYEVQIETDSAAEPASHHTGGVYGFLTPEPEQPRKADEWQTLDLTLIGRRLTVVQNGVTVIANREIPGITGGALDSHEGLPGPICLQGSEPGTVAFRNMVLTPAGK